MGFNEINSQQESGICAWLQNHLIPSYLYIDYRHHSCSRMSVVSVNKIRTDSVGGKSTGRISHKLNIVLKVKANPEEIKPTKYCENLHIVNSSVPCRKHSHANKKLSDGYKLLEQFSIRLGTKFGVMERFLKSFK